MEKPELMLGPYILDSYLMANTKSGFDYSQKLK